jgi:hypothetical protein
MTKSGIERKIAATVAAMAQPGPVLKGTISKARTGHQITWKGAENKTKILYVPDTRLAQAERMVAAYKKQKLLLEHLAELNADLYKITAE